MVVLLTALTFLSTLAGGLLALGFKDRLKLILGFSAGTVLGVCFFDLLPESLALGKGQYSERFLIGIVATGFVLYMLLDRMALLHFHSGDAEGEERGNLAAGGLSFHSFFDGVAIGLGFHISADVGIFMALAVIVHDLSDGLNTVGVVLKNGGNTRRGLKWLLADSIAPVLGVILTYFFTFPPGMFAFVLSLFTGFFLYIGASDLLPESQASPSVWATGMTLLGISTMAVVLRFFA